MAKHGQQAHRDIWLPEFRDEVAALFRLTNDLRGLNAVTLRMSFPLPNIKDLLDSVPGMAACHGMCKRTTQGYRGGNSNRPTRRVTPSMVY